MEAQGRFIIADRAGTRPPVEGKVRVDEDQLVLQESTGGARSFSYRDMVTIDATGYKLSITMVDGTKVEISSLGHRFEDVVREVHRSRNELVMKDLLMGEELRKQGVRGELRSPFRGAEGACEVRLYDSALVLLPQRSALVRVRYSDLRGIEAQGPILRMELESGELLAVGMLGRELDPLWNAISQAMAELEANTQALVKELCPDLSGGQVGEAARLLKEARAARRADLEDISPALFRSLESRLRAAGMGTEYDHLASLGSGDHLRVGIKRSLAAQEDDYLWFMVPLLGEQGNAVAMEATASPGGGRATYFFRVAPRVEYPGMDRESRFEAAEQAMDAITAGLRDINFRREPIYLKDADLDDPRYAKYRHSIALIPRLRDLRHRFIGRVSHTSPEEWTAKVSELLHFNSKAADDGRWAGSSADGPDRSPEGDI